MSESSVLHDSGDQKFKSTDTTTIKASPVTAVDFVEFWCSNAKITARYYCQTFGFSYLSSKSFEVKGKQRISHVICQKDIFFIFTSTLHPDDDEFNDFLKTHGDSVKDVGLRVVDLRETYSHAIKHGATTLLQPVDIHDSNEGFVTIAKVKCPFGDVIHTLLDRSNFTGTNFLPNYKLQDDTISKGAGLTHIDHVTIAYHQGDMMKALDWYINCFGFQQFKCNDEDTDEGLTVQGQGSGLRTIVITSSVEKYSFKFVLVEALEENKSKTKNQINEFLEYNGNAAGIQHLALHTKDMINTIATLRKNGVEFIDVPTTYYDHLFENEAAFMKDSYHTLKDLGILLDISNRSDNNLPAMLMQTFTLPMQDRPTFFMEIISRKGSSGFGRRTIKALFEAVEKLQEQRQLFASNTM